MPTRPPVSAVNFKTDEVAFPPGHGSEPGPRERSEVYFKDPDFTQEADPAHGRESDMHIQEAGTAHGVRVHCGFERTAPGPRYLGCLSRPGSRPRVYFGR